MTKHRKKPFTLIELLVVIAIIGILAGILLPAISSSRESAKKAKAQSTISSLKTAISQYKSTYGQLPNVTNHAIDDLMSVLAAEEGNPRGIVFFEPRTDDSDNIITEDPWGGDYMFMLDSNDGDGTDKYDGKIEVDGKTVYGDSAIWSKGPNGDDEEGKGDDIPSW